MENEFESATADYTVRWVSYLDLLGFTEMVETKNWIDVYLSYTKAVETCTEVTGFMPDIEKTWFSDSFLLYSPDNTGTSFTQIESTTRWFMYYLIDAGVPVRGAISYGDFYANKETNIFFGPAFIEAYYYGENQDWIGFVLTPSAVRQMAQINWHLDKSLNYAYWNIPYKKTAYHDSKITPILEKSLPAYIIGEHVEMNGRNLCLDRLNVMKNGLKDDKLIRKYENTIEFILANKRTGNKD